MPQILFDESGNTGSNFLDAGQPIFTLASLALSSEEAGDLLSKHFGGLLAGGIKDLKYSRLSAMAAGRKAVLSFLRELPAEKQKTYLVLKRFALTAKYVDWVIEPVAHADGLDLYKNGEVKAIANLMWYVAPHVYEVADWDNLLSVFQSWANGSGATTDDLRQTVLSLKSREDGEDTLDKLIKAPFFAKGRVKPIDGKDYKMDISLTSAYCLVRAWMDEGTREIEVVHDRSKVMEAQAARWQELTNSALNAKLMATLPGEWPTLDVRSVRFGDQFSDPGLQLADIVAGANRDAANRLLGFNQNVFAQTLIDAHGLPFTSGGTIFPDRDAIGVKIE